MDEDKQKQIFDEKYQDRLGLSFEEWLQTAPETEDEAYAYCQNIDQELKDTYEEWFEAKGDEREELDNYRQRLKLEYDLVEELFGLELKD